MLKVLIEVRSQKSSYDSTIFVTICHRNFKETIRQLILTEDKFELRISIYNAKLFPKQEQETRMPATGLEPTISR